MVDKTSSGHRLFFCVLPGQPTTFHDYPNHDSNKNCPTDSLNTRLILYPKSNAYHKYNLNPSQKLLTDHLPLT